MHENSRIEHWLKATDLTDLKLHWQAPWLFVQIHRPAQKNALSGKIIQNLKTIFDFIESTYVIRAVIITGGEGNFCAGADLQEIAELRASGETALIANNKHFGELLHRMHLCRIPIIAMIDGPALGGGMGIACASDLIYCTQKAFFGMPEPKLGIIAGQILPYVFRKLGVVKTQEMALQGLRISGQQSHAWNLTNQVFDDFTALKKGVDEALNNIESCGPNAITQTKTMLNRLTAISPKDIDQTAKDVVFATLSDEGMEGGMAFIAKRKPKWNAKEVMES